MLRAYMHSFQVSGLQTDFLTQQRSSTLNGFSISTCVKDILVQKVFSALDMELVCASLDHGAWYDAQPVLAAITILNSDIVNGPLCGTSNIKVSILQSFSDGGKLDTLKQNAK